MENATILSNSDMEAFMEKHGREIDQARAELSRDFPSHELVSESEAMLALLSVHMGDLSRRYIGSVDYVEDMLHNQLISAVGKEIKASDFDDFMSFHQSQKMFESQYIPQLFSYAVRRPGHYPDGVLSIDSMAHGKNSKPIETFTKMANVSNPMFIPISAATSVEIRGERYLHGWMQHQFHGELHPTYQLTARAHQFSGFLVVIGKMAGPNKFNPESAVIVQNKDEVLIRLMTEVLPSAKEFKDAVASLSPEQRAFAEAFRSMQLESSVFGLCIIQLKPQLEKLLNLPDGALTKEIQLTQDLYSLFIDYQIPSDLLSFESAPDSKSNEKLASVRDNVKAVLKVIDKAKEEQLREEKQKAEKYKTRYGPTSIQSEYPSSSPSAGASSSAGSSSLHRQARPVDGAVRTASAAIHRRMNEDVPESAASFSATMASDEGSGSPQEEADKARAEDTKGKEDGQKSAVSNGEDFTSIPTTLDSKLQNDSDGFLRSTIIKTGEFWDRTRQRDLLTASETTRLYKSSTEQEKKKAFDLLDALSRSGSLPIDKSELHVIVAVTHSFEKTVMSTVIQDNMNPIEQVEKSALLLASTIYGEEARNLIGDGAALERLSASFPAIFNGSI
jgi:hypothetical protein